MLRSVKDLESYKVTAEDGDIGTVSDFYFDDKRWTIRYLVAETGPFLSERQVLISPISFRQPDWDTKEFRVALTREKVKGSPDIDLAKPVSRQHERDYYEYYGWPYYWGFASPWSWGVGPEPASLAAMEKGRVMDLRDENDDPHLRSANTVSTYHVQGVDGDIGHVADFIIDDVTWEVRYMVVDTSNWWFGKKVLVSPAWTDEISWADSKVYLGMTRERIRTSPEWKPEQPVNREYEVRLYDYYGRPAYWQAPDDAHKGDKPDNADKTEKVEAAAVTAATFQGVHPAI